MTHSSVSIQNVIYRFVIAGTLFLSLPGAGVIAAGQAPSYDEATPPSETATILASEASATETPSPTMEITPTATSVEIIATYTLEAVPTDLPTIASTLPPTLTPIPTETSTDLPTLIPIPLPSASETPTIQVSPSPGPQISPSPQDAGQVQLAPITGHKKLIFIHHSTGENWLTDGNGDLGIALRDAGYFVSDTNYGWGPDSIGDRTDIGYWYDWFNGTSSSTYMNALYTEYGQNSSYSRLGTDPGGANEIIMFKSCFPNSHLGGNPSDPPTTGANPLRGHDYSDDTIHTVGNAKGIYKDLLTYFATRQDKLFIAITAPPLGSFDEPDASHATNARAFNNWLVNNWLTGYAYKNVAVFDFYNVLTSDGGSTRTNNPNVNDLGWSDGNHHRVVSGAVQHTQTVNNNYSAYATGGDSHPTQAGSLKATGEFVGWLNYYYARWVGAAPPASTLISPSGSISNYTPTYRWNSASGATQYYLWVNGPSGNRIKAWYTASAVGCAGGGVCSVTPATILTGGAHQWWVQTWSSSGFGPWSAGMNFSLVVPPAVTLISPTGSIGVNTPTYRWNSASGATWYHLWVNGPWGNTVINTWYTASQAGCASTCSVTPATTLSGGAHQWWVRTWNSAGYGPWSSPLSFSLPVPVLPPAATLISPSGSITNHTPPYTWNSASGATWYYLWVDGPSGNRIKTWYTASQAGCASGGTCSVTPATTLTHGAHRWWVQTWNSAGYGQWSAGMNFSLMV